MYLVGSCPGVDRSGGNRPPADEVQEYQSRADRVPSVEMRGRAGQGGTEKNIGSGNNNYEERE